jgi:hypothetical protein
MKSCDNWLFKCYYEKHEDDDNIMDFAPPLPTTNGYIKQWSHANWLGHDLSLLHKAKIM